MAPRSARVVVIDDDPLIRSAVRRLLSNSSFLVSDEAESIATARAMLRRDRPDVILLDLGLPDGSGLELLESIGGDRRVVVLTASDDDHHVFEAFRAGAIGYLLKHELAGRLQSAVREALDGGAPMSPAIARRVLESFRRPPQATDDDELTAREREVIELIARGSSYDEVGLALDISTNTVRSHVRKAYEKLRVSSKSGAVREAIRRGILKL